jgi:hypothetical protein
LHAFLSLSILSDILGPPFFPPSSRRPRDTGSSPASPDELYKQKQAILDSRPLSNVHLYPFVGHPLGEEVVQTDTLLLVEGQSRYLFSGYIPPTQNLPPHATCNYVRIKPQVKWISHFTVSCSASLIDGLLSRAYLPHHLIISSPTFTNQWTTTNTISPTLLVAIHRVSLHPFCLYVLTKIQFCPKSNDSENGIDRDRNRLGAQSTLERPREFAPVSTLVPASFRSTHNGLLLARHAGKVYLYERYRDFRPTSRVLS